MKTPISYYGGKQTMLKHILPLIPQHTLYTEAFCGGAAVLFAKSPARAEVINDLNGELINFYYIAQVYPHDLMREIGRTLHARDHYNEALHVYRNAAKYEPVVRAWAVWVLSKLSFASQLGASFGFDLGGVTAKKIRNGKDAFTESLCRRLEHVTIENDDATKVISRYDTATAFHFVDPPYVGSNCGHYEGAFGEENLIQLLDLLAAVKGKFMLTMFPNETIADYADRHGWITHRVTRTITAAKSTEARRKQEEWMVCNYQPEQQKMTLF